MTEEEKLRRDIASLREAIRVSWQDVTRLALTPEQREEVRSNIDFCIWELAGLLTRMDQLDG